MPVSQTLGRAGMQREDPGISPDSQGAGNLGGSEAVVFHPRPSATSERSWFILKPGVLEPGEQRIQGLREAFLSQQHPKQQLGGKRVCA